VAAEFVALADVLRPPPAASRADAPAPEPDPPSPSDAHVNADDDAAARAALHDARLFRARLADALDAAVPMLLRDLASRVLARELRIAPCDIDALVRACASRGAAIHVRVAPGEAIAACAVPVLRDDALAPGDAVVELEGGAIDARFGTRVALVLDELA